MVMKDTALLALTDLRFRPLEAEVDDLKDKINHMKKRKEDIERYAPPEWRSDALKSWKRKVDDLEAELKASEDEMKEAKEAREKAKERKRSNDTSSKGHSGLSGMMTALVASERPDGDTLGGQ